MLQINEYFYHLQGKDLFVHKNHSHNEIEFIHVISGNGLVLKNDKTYILQSQQLYVIDARKTHIVYPQPEDCKDYIRNKIVIDADSFMEFYGNMGMEKILYKLFNSKPISTSTNPKIDKIYKTVYELCSTQKREDVAFAHGYITELIHWLYANSQLNTNDATKDMFQKMLDIINEKDGLTSLSEISKLMHVDKYYLCRMFKEKTGTTLSDYLSDKIYEKCRRMLENTSNSIEEVALQCGFASQSSLSRFFKNKSGISPSKYRKSIKHNVKMYF